jgi:predicted phosphodiesterase
VLETPAGELLAVHGSPRRINEYLFADRPESAMARMAHDNPFRAILFGHTHLPYVRPIGGTAFVNVGSAGRPKDGDWRACYAVVDASRPHADRLGIEFFRVAYDYARLIEALAQTDLITSFDGPVSS